MTNLVSFESPRTPSPSDTTTQGDSVIWRQLPGLDRLVQTAAHKAFALRRERDTVDAVFVTVGSFKFAHDVPVLDLPHADALVEGASGNEIPARRDRDGGNAVFDRQRQVFALALQIPHSHGVVSTAGCDIAPAESEVERIDILLMACEGMADRSALNVPDL